MPLALNRRAAVSALASLGALGALGAPASAGPDPAGPAFADILARRRSVRAYAPDAVDPALRARLLWAAAGINRAESGLRTVPSWHGAADALVYLADASGVGLYDPGAGALAPVLPEDIRGRLSPQPFVATAPLCLIHVSDLSRLAAAAEATDEERRLWAHVDAAVVAQNVYLFCAAEGLGTCLVGGADRAAVAAALTLGPDRLVTFVQPVGWPA